MRSNAASRESFLEELIDGRRFEGFLGGQASGLVEMALRS